MQSRCVTYLSKYYFLPQLIDYFSLPLFYRVKEVLKGIRALHPAPVKKASPFAKDMLARLVRHLNEECLSEKRGISMRQPVIVPRFGRSFGDELTRLLLKDVEQSLYHGLSLYLSQWKGHRHYSGKHCPLPVLNKRCSARTKGPYSDK